MSITTWFSAHTGVNIYALCNPQHLELCKEMAGVLRDKMNTANITWGTATDLEMRRTHIKSIMNIGDRDLAFVCSNKKNAEYLLGALNSPHRETTLIRARVFYFSRIDNRRHANSRVAEMPNPRYGTKRR